MHCRLFSLPILPQYVIISATRTDNCTIAIFQHYQQQLMMDFRLNIYRERQPAFTFTPSSSSGHIPHTCHPTVTFEYPIDTLQFTWTRLIQLLLQHCGTTGCICTYLLSHWLSSENQARDTSSSATSLALRCIIVIIV